MSVISVFKGEVRLTDERHTIGTNKKLVVDLINQEKNRSSHWGQDLFEVGPQIKFKYCEKATEFEKRYRIFFLKLLSITSKQGGRFF